jgi:predicted RNase H-like nuclease
VPLLAGVDGCRTGWVVVTEGGAAVVPTFAAVLALLPEDAIVAVDVPIGLADRYERGGRECDRQARATLGPRRSSSVFPAPPRSALGARTLAAAQARGWPATLQALNLLPKIEEVDAAMTPQLQGRVFEAHPELAFYELNGGEAVVPNKRHADGRARRWALLESAGILRPDRPHAGEAEDDLVDACAELWIAHRLARSDAVRVPDVPPHDARGLRMEIWR